MTEFDEILKHIETLPVITQLGYAALIVIALLSFVMVFVELFRKRD